MCIPTHLALRSKIVSVENISLIFLKLFFNVMNQF